MRKKKLYQIIKSGTEIKDKEKKAPKCLARLQMMANIITTGKLYIVG